MPGQLSKKIVDVAASCNGAKTLSKNGQLTSFHHVKFWVSNAKQAAQWFCFQYGFQFLATQTKGDVTSHVVKSNEIILVFETHLIDFDNDFANHLAKSGDAVKDVAFEVDDLDAIVEVAKKKGATISRDIWQEEDENGTARYAVIKTYGIVVHTLIDSSSYKGTFLPGYKASKWNIALLDLPVLPQTKLICIDHVVGSQPMQEMDNVVEWYIETLSLRRFWSVDNTVVHTEHSGLRVTVLSNDAGTVKLPIEEGVVVSKFARNKIQEFLDYNGGPGVHHIALLTNNIISTVESLKKRGVEFLTAPKTYYSQLRQRLKGSSVNVQENMDEIERLNILMDYDENGYLLQIFTKPLQDKPTLFIEIIQRNNHNGFGAGNIKALFEAVELEQMERGGFLISQRDGAQ